MPLGDILRYHAGRKSPDAVALVYPGARLTWDELDSQSNQLARLYRSLGVGKGDVVALALENGVNYHIAAFATWKLGATPAALSPKLSNAEFAALIELMKPRLLLANLPANLEKPDVQVLRGVADASGFDAAPFPSEVAAHWKISCSGGSTGRPKIIIHDTPALFDPDTPRKEFLLPRDGVVLNPGPLYHNGPFLFANHGMFTGSTLVGMNRFDAEEALRLIEEHRVNWVCLVPTMMHRIWSLPRETRERYDLSSLETVWHMASACPGWLKEAWIGWLGAGRIWERYGGTEGFGSTIISGAEWLERPGSVGRVLSSTKLKIVGEDGVICAPGEIGELYFRPAGEKPPSFYVGAEPKRDGEGYFSLGDLGHQDEEGYVYIADRRTDLILRGGANIYPAEIEAVLDEHPDVASSVVVGLPDDALGARVHAIIEPKGTELDLGSVHAFLAKKLVTYKLPESYEIARAAQRDDAGKVRRGALRAERAEWLVLGTPFRILARDLAAPSAADVGGDTAGS
ncbi:MAG: AMP-dependent synthetase and ligase [Bradyrhizobium sp.]|nr:AMP-dependent synthetase and ligase [Bradyrhizobium sp.]